MKMNRKKFFIGTAFIVIANLVAIWSGLMNIQALPAWIIDPTPLAGTILENNPNFNVQVGIKIFLSAMMFFIVALIFLSAVLMVEGAAMAAQNLIKKNNFFQGCEEVFFATLDFERKFSFKELAVILLKKMILVLSFPLVLSGVIIKLISKLFLKLLEPLVV